MSPNEILKITIDKDGNVRCKNYEISDPFLNPAKNCIGCKYYRGEETDNEKRYVLCREKWI